MACREPKAARAWLNAAQASARLGQTWIGLEYAKARGSSPRAEVLRRRLDRYVGAPFGLLDSSSGSDAGRPTVSGLAIELHSIEPVSCPHFAEA